MGIQFKMNNHMFILELYNYAVLGFHNIDGKITAEYYEKQEKHLEIEAVIYFV